MGDAHEVKLQIRGSGGQEAEDGGDVSENGTPLTATSSPARRRIKWWTVVLLNILFVLAGQSVATLLGRIYYDQGGNSKWMTTVVQSCGMPILIPLLLYFRPKSSSVLRPPLFKFAAIYAGLGVLYAGDNLMYSYGLLYLPVSTYSLVCATQLSFNAIFAYFLNNQKFTALIFNSVVLLTFSAGLLGVSPSSATKSNVPEGKHPLGFVLTLSASAVFSLILSLTQLTFEKVVKNDTFYAVLEMQFWSNSAATCVAVAGLFISGDWSTLSGEMKGYEKGEVAYVMTLAWTAISWQLFTVGMLGLIAMVSSLFTNLISTVGMPLAPVFAVIFLGDRMDGVKAFAMLIALWGFLSYIYQNYLDDAKARNRAERSDDDKQRPQSSLQIESCHTRGKEIKIARSGA